MVFSMRVGKGLLPLIGVAGMGLFPVSTSAQSVSSPSFTVTTIAGQVGVSGTNNGTGTNALFSDPQGIAVDGSTNLYIADTYNYTIRKITPAGVVSTFAGKAGVSGSTNGTGANAMFDDPTAMVADKAGNLYVADTYTIRKITPSGVVSTLAGKAGVGAAPMERELMRRSTLPWALLSTTPPTSMWRTAVGWTMAAILFAKSRLRE